MLELLFSRSSAVAATFVGLITTAQLAAATPIEIEGTAGAWTSVPAASTGSGEPTPDIPGGVRIDTDPVAGSSNVRWGEPAGCSPLFPGGCTPAEQSRYNFTPEVAPNTDPPVAINPDTLFELGSFTHFNFPIFDTNDYPVLQTAELSVVIDILIDGTTQQSVTSVFDFEHTETPNNADTCANGEDNDQGVNINGCADRVVATTNIGQSDTFFVGGVEYIFELLGFCEAPCAGTPTPFSEFWTVEVATNEAILFARYTEKSNLVPVDVPATPLLLSSGALVLLRLSRRQRASDAVG
ncbi:MAG: THxN family PEP-CTERM protein [Halieaceae bacterium]|jgi:hypothetical protein|nr:THxN family PEP-CTERM protein [Halieaceae bacterium]